MVDNRGKDGVDRLTERNGARMDLLRLSGVARRVFIEELRVIPTQQPALNAPLGQAEVGWYEFCCLQAAQSTEGIDEVKAECACD
jgi:hypothetical protein